MKAEEGKVAIFVATMLKTFKTKGNWLRCMTEMDFKNELYVVIREEIIHK